MELCQCTQDDENDSEGSEGHDEDDDDDEDDDGDDDMSEPFSDSEGSSEDEDIEVCLDLEHGHHMLRPLEVSAGEVLPHKLCLFPSVLCYPSATQPSQFSRCLKCLSPAFLYSWSYKRLDKTVKT